MLEFNMPVHENWNIVHIAMQVPQAHQIYVCPDNCMRGVVMTAYEMGAEDRFSCVTVSERDLIADNLETVTTDGVSGVIEELHAAGSYPPVVFIFTVCSHRFLSCDFDYVFSVIRKRYPDIIFVHGYMDCIAQKEGPMPDEKLRLEMYDFISESTSDVPVINILGSEVTATRDNNDLVRLFSDAGVRVRQMSDITSFDEYMSLGDASLNICQYRAGDMGVKHFSEKLNIPYMSALPFADEMTIKDQVSRIGLQEVEEYVNEYLESFDRRAAAIRDEYHAFRDQIGDMPVVVDYMALNCPYSFVRYLSDLGFNVRAVVADGPADYEADVYDRLVGRYGHIINVSPTDPRLLESGYRKDLLHETVDGSDTVLAIGPRAAWVFNTTYYVNQIESAGDYGLLGLKAELGRMINAIKSPKPLDILSLKALGTHSCLR